MRFPEFSRVGHVETYYKCLANKMAPQPIYTFYPFSPAKRQHFPLLEQVGGIDSSGNILEENSFLALQKIYAPLPSSLSVLSAESQNIKKLYALILKDLQPFFNNSPIIENNFRIFSQMQLFVINMVWYALSHPHQAFHLETLAQQNAIFNIPEKRDYIKRTMHQGLFYSCDENKGRGQGKNKGYYQLTDPSRISTMTILDLIQLFPQEKIGYEAVLDETQFFFTCIRSILKKYTFNLK